MPIAATDAPPLVDFVARVVDAVVQGRAPTVELGEALLVEAVAILAARLGRRGAAERLHEIARHLETDPGSRN